MNSDPAPDDPSAQLSRNGVQALASLDFVADDLPSPFRVQVLEANTVMIDGVQQMFMLISDAVNCIRIVLSDSVKHMFQSDVLRIGHVVELHNVRYDIQLDCPRVAEVTICDDLGRHATLGDPVLLGAPLTLSPAPSHSRTLTASPLPGVCLPRQSKWAVPASQYPVKDGGTSTSLVDYPAENHEGEGENSDNVSLSGEDHPAHHPVPGGFDAAEVGCGMVQHATTVLHSSLDAITSALPVSAPPHALHSLGDTLHELSDTMHVLSQRLRHVASLLKAGGKPAVQSGAVQSKRAKSVGMRRASPSPKSLRQAVKLRDKDKEKEKEKEKEREKRPLPKTTRPLATQGVRGKGVKSRGRTATEPPSLADEGQGLAWLRMRVYPPEGLDEAKEGKRGEGGETLSLQRVLGYKGGRSSSTTLRNNLAAVGDKLLVYAVTSVVVVHDIETGKQTYFAHHPDDVVCLAQHSCDPTIFATSSSGVIHVWNTTDRLPIASLPAKLTTVMAFTPCGSLLGTVASDNLSTFTLFNWHTGAVVASTTVGKDSIGMVRGMSYVEGGRYIVTYGQNHLRVWQHRGGELQGKNAIYGRKCETQTVQCLVPAPGGRLITGTTEGVLQVFVLKDSTLSLVSTVKGAHRGPVLTLAAMAGYLVTGGRDGLLQLWEELDGELVRSERLVVTSEVPDEEAQEPQTPSDTLRRRIRAPCPPGAISAMVWVESSRTLFIGSSYNCIFQVPDPLSGCETLTATALQRSHRLGGEFRAVALHPSEPLVVTGADDRQVIISSYLTDGPLRSFHAPGKVRAVTFNKTGEHLALGMACGGVIIYSFPDAPSHVLLNTAPTQGAQPTPQDIDPLEVTTTSLPVGDKGERSEDGDAATVMQYSPDGSLLAVGFRTSRIDIYKYAKGEYTKQAVCKTHHGSIRSIDWSSDASILQVFTNSNELLHFTATGTHLVHPAKYRNAEYPQWTTPVGWATMGIWSHYASPLEVTSVTAHRTALVVGDIHGKLSLLPFPCTGTAAPRRVYKGHSAAISKLAVSSSGNVVVSIGAVDRCILVWEVRPSVK